MTDPILDLDPTLAEIGGRIGATLEPERIYLFGSAARGESGEDSDYDLMVLVREAEEPTHRLAQRAHSLLWGVRAAADILVWTTERFDRRTHLKASLPGTILREGRLIYAH